MNRTTAKKSKMRIWPDWTMRARESETEWLLRMLLQDLQTLASDPGDLIRAYPPMIPAADQLANDFHDHLEFGERFVQEGLITQGMLDKARATDALLDVMSDRHDPSLWTDEAVRTKGEWKVIRRMATEALASMGYDLEPPPSAAKTMKIFPARK